jgi:hypothetical protein
MPSGQPLTVRSRPYLGAMFQERCPRGRGRLLQRDRKCDHGFTRISVKHIEMMGQMDMEIYNDKYVLLMDILGFSRKVQESRDDTSLQREIDHMLTLIYQSAADYEHVDMKVTQFSDNILCSAQRSGDGLAAIIAAVDRLTSNLLMHDYLVRGGLAVGGVHHDSNFVYGPAIVEAHYLESCRAKQPLTLVSTKVIEDATAYGAHYLNHLADDGTGRKFVHFPKNYCDYDPTPKEAGTIIYDRPANTIMTFIAHRLTITTPSSPYDKAKWFADYRNAQVASKGIFGRIEPKPMPANFRKGSLMGFVRLPPLRR